MSDNYEMTCQELDAITLTYLSKLEEYMQVCNETANHFQQGFLDLAHAKYTMGTRTISRYSYDSRMKASLKVEIENDLVCVMDDNKEKEEQVEGLRNRHQKEQIQSKDDSKDESNDTKKKNRDPLYWFGLLVSPSLRTSQKHFSLATERLIDQVNRIKELRELEIKYKELMEKKGK
ncbi:hypothetical protein CU097_001918 [Rhizopus azygosporus]|uniref:Vacuolar ATPase assembly protein VMA22 n=3 Tax=Rhizopus TaxID=4842 RepID=A0A367K3U8_RHIAZ|nr:hypothetical protein CU097_001918 [Rhizopus azygosporus]CEI88821.1 hypothetical protein RMCBS344292_03198 [Rhizopus microsporus]